MARAGRFIKFTRGYDGNAAGERCLRRSTFLRRSVPLPSLSRRGTVLGTCGRGLFRTGRLLSRTVSGRRGVGRCLSSVLGFSYGGDCVRGNLGFILFESTDE